MIGNKYILAAMLACAPLATQAAETVYTFDSVSGIEHLGDSVVITGIRVNDTVPSSVSLPWAAGQRFDRCEKLFNVVLAAPAEFTLTVATELVTTWVGPPPERQVTILVFNRCRADRKP